MTVSISFHWLVLGSTPVGLCAHVCRMNTAPSGASCRTIAAEYEWVERTKDVVLSTFSRELWGQNMTLSQRITKLNHLDVLDHALKVQAFGFLLIVAILSHICVAYSTRYTIMVAWCRRETVNNYPNNMDNSKHSTSRSGWYILLWEEHEKWLTY